MIFRPIQVAVPPPVTATATSSATASATTTSTSTGAAIGGAVGGVAVLVIAGIAFAAYLRKLPCQQRTPPSAVAAQVKGVIASDDSAGDPVGPDAPSPLAASASVA